MRRTLKRRSAPGIIALMIENHLAMDARAMFEAGLAAVNAEHAVSQHLRATEDVAPSPRKGVRVLALGKAASAMTRGAASVLGLRLQGGLCVSVEGAPPPPPGVALVTAAHPLPDLRSLDAAARARAVVRSCLPGDELLVLLSGGTSSLMEMPAPGLTLDDLVEMHGLLLRSGAPIGEMNAVRAALSRVKGGRLLLELPAGVACRVLVVSDVPGNALEVVGSGPFHPTPAPASRAIDVLRGIGLLDDAPRAVVEALSARRAEDAAYIDAVRGRARDVSHVVVADCSVMAQAAATRARALGYDASLLSTRVDGEARDVGALLARLSREVRREVEASATRRRCIIASGESTVRVSGDGRGGRCQEAALAFATRAEGTSGALLLCAASDGIDGPTPAAGALADGRTAARARTLGLDAREMLLRHDAYDFFEPLGDLVVTGPTQTNTNELYVLLVEGGDATS